jgi:hypothetical protein
MDFNAWDIATIKLALLRQRAELRQENTDYKEYTGQDSTTIMDEIEHCNAVLWKIFEYEKEVHK